MPGRTFVCAAAAVVVLLGASSLPAHAHGGGFQQANPDPGPVEPEKDAPPKPPAPVTPSSGKRGRYPRALGIPTWHAWWLPHAGTWDVREGHYRLRGPLAVTPSETGGSKAGAKGAGGAGASGRAAKPGPEDGVHRLLLERARSRVVVPYLREVTAPGAKRPAVMVGAALLAWARISEDAEVVPVLEHHARDRSADLDVRVAAARAFGYLRRSGEPRLLDVTALTDVRELLLALHDDLTNPLRVRTTAIYALSMLADQPYEEGPLSKDGRGITRALWLRLERPSATASVCIALLTALGSQPPAGVADGIRSELRSRALTVRTLNSWDGWDGDVRARALRAYACLDVQGALPVIRRAVEARGDARDVRIQTAAFRALAEIAPRLSSTARLAAVKWIPPLLSSLKDDTARGFAVVALGALLHADLVAGETGVLEDAKTGALLMRLVRKRPREHRSFPPLALAVASRIDRPVSRPAAVFRTEACKVLAKAATRARGQDNEVSPVIAAVGIARVEAARSALLEILKGEHRSWLIRGHAARALGNLGSPDMKTLEGLVEATRDRIHPFVHEQASRALGLLAAPGACDELLLQLEGDPTRGALVSVARSLGYLGDPKAVDRLVALARNRRAGVNVRRSAIAALGQILAPE